MKAESTTNVWKEIERSSNSTVLLLPLLKGVPAEAENQ